MTPSESLTALNIQLPTVPAPIGSYVPAIKTGNLILTSGQLPLTDGKLLCTGKVGSDVTLEHAADAARVAVINALAAAATLTDGIDNIARIIKLTVYVNSAPGFTDQPEVANGASDLLAEIFGENGRHARAAIGVSELPINAAIELDLIAETR